jgi:hypothetical protein
VAETVDRIFVSYRREHDGAYAGWLFERLIEVYGKSRVFKDVDSLEPGIEFGRAIVGALEGCGVVLVLVGEDWMRSRQSGPPGIFDPSDWVRMEIEAALAMGKRIIPVTLEGAQVPPEDQLPPSIRPLATRQATTLGHSTFDSDVHRLARLIDGSFSVDFQSSVEPTPSADRTQRFKRIDDLYRRQVVGDSWFNQKHPFLQPTYRRPQLERLADALDPGEDVVEMAIARVTGEDRPWSADADTAALTARRLMCVPFGNQDVFILPFAHILNMDRQGRFTLVFTLPRHNVTLWILRPYARLRAFETFIRDRIDA